MKGQEYHSCVRRGRIDRPPLPCRLPWMVASCDSAMLQLAKPVYHAGYVDDVIKILRCVCFYCSRLLLDPVSHFFVYGGPAA